MTILKTNCRDSSHSQIAAIELDDYTIAMQTYFLSDLHLKREEPQIIEAFLQFLMGPAANADQVYVLGDLFEYWVGDDAVRHIGVEPVLAAMRELSQTIPCFFIAGNRDFLVRQGFSEASGFTILPDETVIDLYGTPTLILHGDSLCTDDIKHQQFRTNFVTNKLVCDLLLGQPLKERLKLAEQARGQSQSNSKDMDMTIMDVSHNAVLKAFKQHSVKQMIHGHTHRQATHAYDLDMGQTTRFVLGDWHTSSSILTATADGIRIDNQPIEH